MYSNKHILKSLLDNVKSGTLLVSRLGVVTRPGSDKALGFTDKKTGAKKIGCNTGGSIFVRTLVWVVHNGNIPAGHVVTYRSGDWSDDRLENLKLATRSEIVLRMWGALDDEERKQRQKHKRPCSDPKRPIQKTIKNIEDIEVTQIKHAYMSGLSMRQISERWGVDDKKLSKILSFVRVR